jgi:hypothetical protein
MAFIVCRWEKDDRGFRRIEHVEEAILAGKNGQGGTKGGTWKWERVGLVNGALLWPDALDYFVKMLGYKPEAK